ncbi:hypothetical protein DFH06DRAFT_42548 [Mycena polygramma]|nr:hypothetical protein DFH06DRAFT_42548 [Mycena polygramma]
MPRATTPSPQLAGPSGRWIHLSDARKDYGLATSELGSILPISVGRNSRHYRMSVTRYNEEDVQELAEHIREACQVPGSTGQLAVANDREILRSTAMKRFSLEACQLDRIDPVSEGPNPYGGTTLMRYYNLRDVQALVASIATALAAPTVA